jgi:hypothetical protein
VPLELPVSTRRGNDARGGAQRMQGGGYNKVEDDQMLEWRSKEYYCSDESQTPEVITSTSIMRR